ncbi:30S ribosomal protein S17 [candidate division WWE3 bacterium RIFCSPHIGHO2_01_FULL_35_17]|uniref:30S ribosomal protein S17 n=1 Tax=candidate division WWE3 bacterium RIFCSPHIGHO2_01_FULL_35_17 TaxID=1802614 RepID=A0A1F4US61_UNCKA|nr:MAG: 30S ribosomal protein S17 [candidate division WWE3 bacterium RIFCSPHIGHO2_01_FULL_35_17]
MSGKILKGHVVSSKMAKTLTVKVEFSKKHERYNKRYIFHNNFKVHCEDVSKFKEGDLIQIIECAPISKTKNWVVFTPVEVKKKVAKEKK